MSKNGNLAAAKRAKNDEFYTQRSDIEAELCHYEQHFRGKTVYCNCDDPTWSEFWKFFVRNFKPWGLKKLIATHYEPDAQNFSYKLELEPDADGSFSVQKEPTVTPLPCNGDFRSAACIELLKEADIVVTNPPFSLFREYVAQLMEYRKKFLIIGNQNAITYKEIFPLLKDNKMWLGYHVGDMAFKVPDYYEERATRFWVDETGQKWRSLGNACWFTNLDIPKRHEPLDLRGNYYYGNEDKYPHYDNYDAINVDRVSDIPCDYDGVMGVPITFLGKYCPEQFEIVSFRKGDDGKDLVFTREREREFNRTFGFLFDGVDGSDYGCEADDLQRRKESVCSCSDTTENMKLFAEYICARPELVKIALVERERASRRSSSMQRTCRTDLSTTAESTVTRRTCECLSDGAEFVLPDKHGITLCYQKYGRQNQREADVCSNFDSETIIYESAINF